MNYSQFLNMIPEATLMVVLLITFIADFCWEDIDGNVSHHQETYQRIEPLTVCALGTAEVSNESDQQNYHQGSFWNHI
jgi:hypothetical protein